MGVHPGRTLRSSIDRFVQDLTQFWKDSILESLFVDDSVWGGAAEEETVKFQKRSRKNPGIRRKADLEVGE